MAILIPRPISRSAPASADWTSRSSESPEPGLWATVSGKVTRKLSSWIGWKRRPWSQRLFGTICEPSQEDAFVDWWIGLLEASRASRTQSQERCGEQMMTETSSTPSASSLARWSRESSSWKMSAGSLPGMGLDDSLDAWPPSGSMRNGAVYRHPMSVPPIIASASSFWPTPAARDYKGANSSIHCSEVGTGRKHLDQLPNFVAHLWPGLPDQTQTGAEPPNTSGRRLNPAWVEWLMGFPAWWSLPCDTAPTDSDASETP